MPESVNLPSMSVVVPAMKVLSFAATSLMAASRSGSCVSRSFTMPVMFAAKEVVNEIRRRVNSNVKRLKRVILFSSLFQFCWLVDYVDCQF